MGHEVPIDSIVTNRTLDPGDDVEGLAKHVHDSGLQVPVLVNQNYELIDGLRRIHAVRSLGRSTIEVVAVTMFGPAATWLERARKHGALARELTPRRLWELYSACLPLIAVSRSHEMRGKQHGKGVHIKGRERFLAALGMTSESHLQATSQLYRMALEQSFRGEMAREAVALVDTGKITPYGGLDYVRQRQRRGDIVKAPEQLAILANTTSALAGIKRGLDQLGPLDPAMDQQALKEVIKDLYDFRRDIHQLLNKLRKGQDTSE